MITTSVQVSTGSTPFVRSVGQVELARTGYLKIPGLGGLRCYPTGHTPSRTAERVGIMSYTAYDALAVMETTGPAYLADGVLVDGGEYVAALYESYAADCEPETDEYPELVANRYAHTAQRAAEDTWTRDLEEVESKIEYTPDPNVPYYLR